MLAALPQAHASLIGTNVTFGTLFQQTSTSTPVVDSTTATEPVVPGVVTFPSLQAYGVATPRWRLAANLDPGNERHGSARTRLDVPPLWLEAVGERQNAIDTGACTVSNSQAPAKAARRLKPNSAIRHAAAGCPHGVALSH
jgi:hypothetical protein